MVQWMRNEGMLKSSCSVCGFANTLVVRDTRRAIDMVCAHCPNCQKRRSVRVGSFFLHHPRLPLHQLLTVIAWWWEDLTASSCARMNDYNRWSVTRIYTNLDLLSEELEQLSPIQFTNDMVIEIDGAAFITSSCPHAFFHLTRFPSIFQKPILHPCESTKEEGGLGLGFGCLE